MQDLNTEHTVNSHHFNLGLTVIASDVNMSQFRINSLHTTTVESVSEA